MKSFIQMTLCLLFIFITAFLKADLCCPQKKSLCQLSNQILARITALENELLACCSNLESLAPCSSILTLSQSDIPTQINRSAYVCIKEDLFFDGSLVTNAGIEGPTAIAVNADNVVIDLNNHTITYKGAGSNAIATIGTAAHVTIKNGTIAGSPDSDTSGILVLTSNVTIENVRIINAAGSSSSAILLQGAFLSSPSSQSITLVPQNDIVIKKCDLEGNFYGIILNTFSNSILIKECTINNSIQMGITQPSRKNISTNVVIDSCTISNSGLNGIYTTFSQANWAITNCTISNSALNGMILAGFSNLKVQGCQIFDSGAHGITVSIRQSENVEISGCQIFNCADTALRVDNTTNLTIRDCQIANFVSTASPLMKIQDIYTSLITGCTLTSGAGTSDGLLLRNCHGLTVENTNAQVFCNQPQTSCPIAFNLQGDVTSSALRNCTISGNPSVGIALEQDALNGPNSGVVLENCQVTGAVNQGILLTTATDCGIYNCKVIQGAGDGIQLGAQTSQCSVQNNTLINNKGFGINDLSSSSTNRIYHNFAQGNNPNFSATVPLVTGPANNVGVLNNIDN